MGTRTIANVNSRRPGARGKWTFCSKAKAPVQVRRSRFPQLTQELGGVGLCKTIAAGCSFPLSFEGLCRPARKATAMRGRAWQCDQSSVRFPLASSRVRLPPRTHTRTLDSGPLSNSEFSASEPLRPSSQAQSCCFTGRGK